MNWKEQIETRRQDYPLIWADRKAGLKVTELSKKYGRTRQRIYKILAKQPTPCRVKRGKGRSFKSGHPRRLKQRKNSGQAGNKSGNRDLSDQEG